MGVRDFRELVCWRLSYELKCEVLAFIESRPAARDFKYRDQIKDSSASAPRNVAEGFGRFRPGDFARFLEIAVASLKETQNHLVDGRDRGYLANPLYSRLHKSRQGSVEGDDQSHAREKARRRTSQAPPATTLSRSTLETMAARAPY